MKLALLFRPSHPDVLPLGVIAVHDARRNIVFYNREIFDTLTKSQQRYVFQNHKSVLATTELPNI